MTLTRRQLVSASLTLLPFKRAWAQTYPDRPVRLIVPYAPGGSTDLIGRLIAEPLGRALGGAVVVDNKSGAGGMLGTAEAARAVPDGHTLAIGTVSTMVIFPAVHSKPGYSIDQFAPVTNIAVMPNVLAVNPQFPANDLKELIAVLKASPGVHSFASSGVGSINHMLGESFQAGAGVKLTHVPYRGTGPAIQDVVGGQVPMLFDQLPSSKSFIDGGKLKLIGVIAPKRLPEYPNVMTMEEAGMVGFVDQAWYGLVAPAQTPATVRATLTEAMKQVMESPDVRSRIAKLGAMPVGNVATEFDAQIRREIAAMRRLVGARSIKLED